MVPRPRGRPPKYPSEEVRDRLVDAGRAALDKDGVTSGLDAITLDGAIADAGVPRGSAYRLWRSEQMTPQDAFRRAVTIDILRDVPASIGFPRTSVYADQLLESLAEKTDHHNPDVRRRDAKELVRVVVGDNFERLEGSRNWQIYNALRSAAFSRYHLDPEIADAIKTGETALIRRYAGLYKRMADIFEHTIRHPFTWEEFSAAAYALNDGLANRATDIYRRRGIRIPEEASGSGPEWTLVATSFLALADFFIVPNP